MFGQAGPQMIFGRLYQWLNGSKNEKEVGPIREVLRRHILDTMSVTPGGRLLGEEVRTTKMHSVASLSAQSGFHHKTLRNALALAGLVPKKAGMAGTPMFDAAAGEALVKQLCDAIPQTQLPGYMNATRGQVFTLMKSGILEHGCVNILGGCGCKTPPAITPPAVAPSARSARRPPAPGTAALPD